MSPIQLFWKVFEKSKRRSSTCFWAFFVASIRFSTQSLSSNHNLVTKIAFPRAVFPLSAVASQLFDFLIAALVVVAVALFGVSPTVYLLWVPVLLALLIAQVAGLALLLSAANLFFRDVKYLVEVVLKTLGARRSAILRIFLIEYALLGGLAALFGLASGCAISFTFRKSNFPVPSSGKLSTRKN